MLNQPEINWQDKQFFLFDFDNILLDSKSDHLFWQDIMPKVYAQQKSLNVEQARALLTSYLNEVADKLDYHCIDYWEKKIGINILDLRKLNSHLIKLNKYSEKFLFYINNLKPQPNVYLISNAHPKILDYQIKLMGLECFFNNILSSHIIGHIKEAPLFWQAYIKKFNINPQNAILFDNNLKSAKNAYNLGINVIINNIDNKKFDDKNLQYINNLADLLPQTLTKAPIFCTA